MTAKPISLVKAPRPDSTPVKYAKLTRPAIHDVMPRTRLFARLEELRQKHRIIWITSPPGAGKTTLAASYVADQAGPAVWYQVDESDSDPATLFYFLQEALLTLPSFDLTSRIAGMTETSQVNRLFFRDFYAHLPAGSIIVFDNVHEFDWKNSGTVMEHAFSEIPSNLTVIALSREVAPARLSKMELSGQLGLLSWDELRLDNAEVLALAGRSDDEQFNQNLIDCVDGWVAGVILLKNSLKNSEHSPEQPALQNGAGRETIFRYFAGEIFDRMSAPSQHMLMQLSCLPGFSLHDAMTLTQEPAVAELLKSLYRDNFFIEQRGQEKNIYQLHALFRQFLQFEFLQRSDPEQRAALFEQAAALLESGGRIQEAAELLQTAQKHLGLITLLLNHASSLMNSGRGQQWRNWMSSLPIHLVDAQPDLWYWHGISLIDIAPRRARQILIRAEQAFHQSGKLRSRLLSIAAIMQGFEHEWSDHHLLLPWIESMSGGLAELDEELIDPDLDLILYSRLLLAMIVAAPDQERMSSISYRIRQILPMAQNPVEQLTAGTILLKFFDTGYGDFNFGAIDELLDLLNQCANNVSINPFHRVKWYASVARRYSNNGFYQESQQLTETARDLVVGFNLEPHLFLLIETNHLIQTGNLESAKPLLEQLQQSSAVLRNTELVEMHTLQANWHSLSGNISLALACVEEAIELCTGRLQPPAELSKLDVIQAALFALLSDFSASEDALERAQQHAFGYDQTHIAEVGQFLQAFQYWKNGDDAHARIAMEVALRSHCQRQASTLFPMIPLLAGQIALIALQSNIYSDHINTIIRVQQLHSPDRFMPEWPWHVRVRAFGQFELAINGVVLESTGKSQQRPLMLLKALISCGDRGSTMDNIAALLWPDSEDAKATLNVTVFRLRKILVTPEVVLVSGGKIQLADNHVWSDLMALANLCDEIEYLKPDVAVPVILKLAGELLDIYRGPFCDGEQGSWFLPVRERLKSRFLNAAERIGHRLEASHHWREAIALYQRAIEAEPLAESCYRGLMRCMHAEGDISAALNAFGRCRHMLSIVAGLTPSADTLALSVALGLKA